MQVLNHEKYMQRCLQIAKNGLGFTRPNPSVGAVLVVDDCIVGEGFTASYGGNHAEVNAINSVKNKRLLQKATLYVTLEPCSHVGKTPPCADLIIKEGIKKIVIGCVDTNSLVAGKGIERLKKAGCEVLVGVLEEECFEHHKRFFTVQNNKRPYIILKWAETKDGFIAPFNNDKNVSSIGVENNCLEEQKESLFEDLQPIWISNQYSQQLVHKWRSEEHAILVGTKTVLADNPLLTVRSWAGNNPIRIVLDRDLRIPTAANVYDGSVKTIFINEKKAEKKKENVLFERVDFSKNLAQQVCNVLQKHEIQSVIIEGGAQTLQTFIDADCWGEARVFVGDVFFKKGLKAPSFNGKLTVEKTIKNDVLKIYKSQIIE